MSLRGLLGQVERTAGGYGLFDADALQRPRFVRAAFKADIGLDMLACSWSAGARR